MESAVRLLIASCLLAEVVARLLLWRWHMKRDREWLDKNVGLSEENQTAAAKYHMIWVAVCSIAALVVLYA